jgi:hypothetical protein
MITLKAGNVKENIRKTGRARYKTISHKYGCVYLNVEYNVEQ